jgi:hypothetical protein
MRDDLVPIIKDVAGWLGDALPPILAELAAFWREHLQPALVVVADFIKSPLIPVISALAQILSITLVPAIKLALGILGEIIDAFAGIVSAVKRVIEWWDSLGEKLDNLADKLPDWLVPGSPTPLELALRGIADAMKEVTGAGEQMTAMFSAMGAVAPLGGGYGVDLDFARGIKRPGYGIDLDFARGIGLPSYGEGFQRVPIAPGAWAIKDPSGRTIRYEFGPGFVPTPVYGQPTEFSRGEFPTAGEARRARGDGAPMRATGHTFNVYITGTGDAARDVENTVQRLELMYRLS